jgi:hypothetical protein
VRFLAVLIASGMTRLGGQNSPWLMSAADLADLIDERRKRAR